MKLSIGWFRAENGTKWHVDYINDKWAVGHSVNGNVAIWDANGSVHYENGHWNLVAQWTDPVPWDWGTTPPWLHVLHKGPYGNWRLFKDEPLIHNGNFAIPDAGIDVPEEYHPKWSGDWKLSKTMRPKELKP